MTLRVLLVVSVWALWSCRGPDSTPRAPVLPVDISAMSQPVPPGVRQDALREQWRARGRVFARKLFGTKPMPNHMPMRHGSAARAGDDLIRRMKQGARLARRSEPPAWTRGVPRPPSDSGYDLHRPWTIEVGRGETMSLLVSWSGQDERQIRRANKGVFRRRRGTHWGDELLLVMSPNQKLAFDRARETFQTRRIESYFSRRYIAKVVQYVVKRGDIISRVATRYGTSPGWLLADFNRKDFRTLQPGDTVLIPVVKNLPHGRRSPPALRVVDEDGNPLAPNDREGLERRLASTRLLGRARAAIDDSSVFERPLAEVRQRAVPRGVLPTGLSHLLDGIEPVPTALGPVASTPLMPVSDFPAVKTASGSETLSVDRQVVIRSGETLGHLAKWSTLSYSEIQERNPDLEPDRLLVGQRIVLPLTDESFADFILARSRPARSRTAPPTVAPARRRPPAPIAAVIKPSKFPPGTFFAHIVRSGETGARIAETNGVTLGAVRRANPKMNLDRLRPGDILRIPAAGRR